MHVERFFDAIAKHGSRPALNDGARTWTYRDLEREVRAWIEHLEPVGARRVAYRLPNGCNWIALDLALLKTGRIAVPIPDFFSRGQERHVLAQSGVDTYIVEADRAAEDFDRVAAHAGCDILQTRVAAAPPVHDGTAKITFTSGTTGNAKGVCLSATQLLATAASIEAALGGAPGWRHVCVLPLSLLLENVAGVYANLVAGHEVCVPTLLDIGVRGSSGLDVARFVEAQNRYRPQSIILVPQLLLAMTAAAEFGVTLPDSYRFVAVGGATVPVSLVERAQRVGIPVFEGYGLTECGSVVALNLPGANCPGTVGRSLGNVGVEIVDGDIHVSGASMLGYLGEARAPKRIATGDLGTLDADGYLRVLGRRKSGFITAFGRNVSPEWIESELQTQFVIAYAAVFGEALPEIVALIVARGAPGGEPGGEPSDETIQSAIDAANAHLPDYARVALWRRVSLTEFAAAGCLTENGRPRRDVIVRQYRRVLEDMYSNIQEQLHAAVREA
jgi:long-chain acyl-CoA synthetase